MEGNSFANLAYGDVAQRFGSTSALSTLAPIPQKSKYRELSPDVSNFPNYELSSNFPPNDVPEEFDQQLSMRDSKLHQDSHYEGISSEEGLVPQVSRTQSQPRDDYVQPQEQGRGWSSHERAISHDQDYSDRSSVPR
ncbi:uncharacterized protein LOC102807417 [Saccoglossus kowalevskii]